LGCIHARGGYWAAKAFFVFFVKLVPRLNGPRLGLQPRQPGPWIRPGGGGARTVVHGACWGKGGVGGSKGGTIHSMWRFEWIREEDIAHKKRIGEGEIVKDITRQYIIGGLYG